MGAQVKAQEKASPIVFWKISDGEEQEHDTDEAETGKRFVARGYWVFNVAQVKGFDLPDVPKLPETERVKDAEAFFSSLGAEIRHRGSKAYYNPGRDFIQLPNFETFRTTADYFNTLAHEVTHWSGAAHRLARDLSGRFKSNAYAAEELVAELGAAFVMAKLGLSSEPRPDHAAYIAPWLSLLKSDSRAIFTAASKAQQAVDWLTLQQEKGLSPTPQSTQAMVQDANPMAHVKPASLATDEQQPSMRRTPMAAKELTRFQDDLLTVTLWQGENDSPTKEDRRVTLSLGDKEITLPSEHLFSLARVASDAQTLIDYHRKQIPFEEFYQKNDFEFARADSTGPQAKTELGQKLPDSSHHELSPTSGPEPELY